jgi:hypothetical protein
MRMSERQYSEFTGILSPVRKKTVVKRIEARPLKEMKLILQLMKIDFIAEHRFHETRQWRFDISIPSLKIAIEYEGIMSRKSRHTTVTGYTKDCEKYNAATIAGWRVLRYNVFNYRSAGADVESIIRRR